MRMNKVDAEFRLVDCQYETHGREVLAIFNHAILHTVSLYEYKPRAMQDIRRWFEHKQQYQFPVLGLLDQNDRLAGFASYGYFRPQAAYQYSIEHSVYIHRFYQGRGLGTTLLQAIIAKATQNSFHTMIAAIDSSNAASIALHQKLGFSYAGTLRQSGYKFEQWLDVVFYQLMLAPQPVPVDE